MRLRDAISGLLPLIAIGVLALTVGAVLAAAGDTHGYDFRAYYDAAVRVLHGQSAYDQAYDLAGAGGLFFYPPTFIPLVLPFGLLGVDVATWTWTGLMLAAFAGAVVAMPVTSRTRWWIVLLAAVSWPFIHNIKLGQVGPLLLLLFAVAWRWRDRPVTFGVASGLGAAIKVQPGLLLVWALLRRQWTAVIAGALTLLGLAGRRPAVHWARGVARLPEPADPGVRPDRHAAELHARRHRLAAGRIARAGRADPAPDHGAGCGRRSWRQHCGCLPRRRSWSRSSPPSSSRRSCGTTTRSCCCCRRPGCSTGGTPGPR